VTTEVTLVDTNILLDLVTNDTVWVDWSQRQLEAAAVRGAVLINDVVYAELAVGFLRVEEVDAVLAAAQVEMTAMPREALFLAGKVFQRYRAGGGTRSGVLPDFFIGAHAAVAQLPLLTRDVRRYRTYFPTVQLIAPTD
jgi:predicted nucleic acid-binding protein